MIDLYIYDHHDRCLHVSTHTIAQAIRLGRAVCDTEPGCWFGVYHRGVPRAVGARDRTDVLSPRPFHGWARVPRKRAA